MKHLLEILILVLNALSIIVIVWGAALAFINFIKSEVTAKNKEDTVLEIGAIKNDLGSYILLGLEILICADIIESILNPTINDMVILASIVVIRTFISYFLNKEMESNHKK
ncbi:DUF1622 domain-containing protein [Clostridium sardiniense]|uniref:DUF1622 domain-containing protein n=1 Tax=Clostridium sardiniense TaxID=29369 RepID=UPI003D32F017